MLRFSIRDVLWLMVVVALIVVWRADLARQKNDIRDALRNNIVDVEEGRLLIAKAKNDPQLFADLKAISASERQLVQHRLSLFGQYREFFAKARKLPNSP